MNTNNNAYEFNKNDATQQQPKEKKGFHPFKETKAKWNAMDTEQKNLTVMTGTCVALAVASIGIGIASCVIEAKKVDANNNINSFV